MVDVVEDLSVDKLVDMYIKIRDKVREHEEQISHYKKQLQVVSDKMLDFCTADNLSSIRTPKGTIIRRMSCRYWTNDWDAMYKFIHEQNAAFLLEKRINNTMFKEFLEHNPELVPPGLQATNEYVISVRKPTAK